MSTSRVTAVALAALAGAASGEQPTLQAPDINLSPGPAYADGRRLFQGIPSVAMAPDGRLWATWYGGGEGEGPENYVMAATSGDDGATWSTLKLVIDPPFRASEPAFWCDPRGRMWLMWNQYPMSLTGPNSELWAVVTDDADVEGPVWSKPRLIARDLNCFNKPIALSDGGWVWPAGSWYKPNPSQALLSVDRGVTFVPSGPIVVPEGREFDEYNVVELRDGRLWLLCRTKAGMVESYSNDGGRTWTVATPSAIQHATARHFLTRLRSGNLLLVKHGPIDQRIDRSRLTAYVSEDDGKTWHDGLMLDERKGVSYPDGVQAEDGVVYIIYDYDRTGAKEILLARFTEDDVVRGTWTSSTAAQRLVVNKATGVKSGSE